MGTLTDITSKAVNKNMRAGGSPLPTSKGTRSQTENSPKANFMTPTMASAKKATHNRTSTPTSMSIEKAVTGKWMTSAVRRVGLRRIGGDGTPRSKKEGPKHFHNAVTFPDKFSAPAQSQMPDSPRPTKTPASSLSDKPLPSPPIALVKGGHIEEPRSLIDASEKPLRRTSPKSPQKEEEWPVLFPQKPTTPDAIRKMLQQPALEPPRVVSKDQERYPLLFGSEVVTANLLHEPMSEVPSTHQIQRKEVYVSNLQEKHAQTGPAEGQKKNDTNRATNEALTNSETPQVEPKPAHRLSAGAAAVEKSSSEAKLIKEPRQTRTSSLRARISAGQVIRDSPNKILGFTDFTVEKAPSTKASNENLECGVGFRARSSSSFSKAFAKKPSRESLGGSRAPAQFVAGSRRPATRRPSSRNSLRSDSRAPSPAFLEPSRPAPPVPTAKTATTGRKSSIPIARNTVPAAMNKENSKNSSNDASTSMQSIVTEKPVNNEPGTVKDRSNAASEHHDYNTSTAGYSDQNAGLESIEESPKSTFRSKRLSTNPSAHGPTLKISSSANRLIMGTEELNKENQPLAKKKSKDLFRAAVTNEYRNITKGKNTIFGQNKTSSRPLSNQGFPEDRSRSDSPGNVDRVKKAKSVEITTVFSTAGDYPELTAQESEGENKHDEVPSVDDPFFDNSAGRRSRSEEGGEKGLAGSEAPDGISTASVVSLVKDSPTAISDAMPVVPAFLPEILKEHVERSNAVLEPIRVDEVKARKAEHCALNVDTDLQSALKKTAPTTPRPGSQSDGNLSPDSFPPRSSSRMKHPDYTINRSAKSSSVSPIDQAAAQLQQEISAAQPAEATVTEGEIPHQLSHTDSWPSHREIASQTILADIERKRDSTTRESQKSQTSMSKGLMSNFRGLFHKRVSDNSETSSAHPIKKGGKRPTVTAHGSPFPSMSNIHPIHRPTQASINRTSATSQRASFHRPVTTSPGNPAFASPIPSDVSITTTLAMQILDSVRRESSSPKKERLLELGKLMVDTITQARDAEKAMEEAKQAARKAELAHALCKKSVSDVANMVKEWKGDINSL